MKFDSQTEINIQNWNKIHNDEEYINLLKKTDSQIIVDSFYKNLEFGTGGLRGLMGIGTNRVNAYTIHMATQAFSNYLKKKCLNSTITITIGFDTRLKSKEFAEEAAKVFAGNEIYVYLSKKPIPTPIVSYGCRFYKCQGAVMITASHNPPKYNGYKVYWEDGGQVLPPHDIGIMKEYQELSKENKIFRSPNLNNSFIQYFDQELIECYLKEIHTLQLFPNINMKNGNALNITYSSLHGTGIVAVPEALKSWGFNNVNIIPEQANVDGNFSTIDSPNPELKEALNLGIKKMLSNDSDIFFATDPDSDRLGVVINDKGVEKILSGNEIASLCLHHICTSLKEKDFDFTYCAVVKSVVTTQMFDKIANHYQVSCFNVLPGFKYIAQLMEKWEKEKSYKFLFGCEESLGYLIETFCRDKDAISICNLISEMALKAKLNQKNLKDILIEMSDTYGVYEQTLKSIHFEESKEGHDRIKKTMNQLIENPPEIIHEKKIIILEDYHKRLKKNFIENRTSELTLPSSNLLIIYLEDNTKLMIRPSGTEPKIKIYCEVQQELNGQSYEETKNLCKSRANDYITAVEHLLNKI